MRDELALERTRLAVERTVLAHVRTGLAFVVAGVTIPRFIDDLFVVRLSYVVAVLGAIGIVVGLYRFVVVTRRIRALSRCRPS